MPSDDIKSYATSDTDFYDILGITFETSQKDFDRAWRKTALKYHPDKVGNDAAAREKFHLAQIGYDLLSDPSSKAIYDNARNARLQRKRQNELFEGRRRQMKDDLEARERGVKRSRDQEHDEEEKLQREIRRLAEDGKRRRKDREEALRREMDEEQQQQQQQQQTHLQDNAQTTPRAKGQHTFPTGAGHRVSELDRTVKVRWPVDGDGGNITAEKVKEVFATFGPVESADLLKSKMLRLNSSKKKQMAVICMVQFASVVGAHAAVEDFPKQKGSEWRAFDFVAWAADKEPDFINSSSSHQKSGSVNNLETPSAPSTPTPSPSNPFAHLRSNKESSSSSSPSSSTTTFGQSPISNEGKLNKKPSFASFSHAASSHTPKSSAFGSSTSHLGPNSPSLEEVTMIRLKEAEKRRLAAEIQRQDEAADAAAAAAATSAT